MVSGIFFLGLLAGLWGLLVWHLAAEWWRNPQYGYGLLVPGLCGWLLIRGRREIQRVLQQHRAVKIKARTSRTAYFLLCLGALFILPLELYRQVAPGLRGFGWGGTLLCFGATYWTWRHLGLKKIPRPIAGAALLFLTAVPWPTTLEVILVQGLMRFTANLTAEILNWLGILATARGNLIELESGILGIDEACSGVRSLQACLMGAVLLGETFRLPWRRVALLVILGQGLALLGNLVRAFGLSWLAATQGVSSLEKFHDPAGWTILVLVTVLLYRIGVRWSNPEPDSGAPAQAQAQTQTPTQEHPKEALKGRPGSSWPIHWEALPPARVPLLLALLAFAGTHLWYFAREQLDPAHAIPLLVWNPAEEIQAESLRVPTGILNQLQPQQGSYYQGRAPRVGEVAVYHFFWKPSPGNRAAFFHRPDLCMPGIGWELIDRVEPMTVELDGKSTRWYLFRFKRDEKEILQAWGVWRNGYDQVLYFDQNWRRVLAQEAQRWQFVRAGKRTANTEIASVAILAGPNHAETLQRLIPQLFSTSLRPASRSAQSFKTAHP